METLESRILYSAAPAPVEAPAADEAPPAEASDESPAAAAPAPAQQEVETVAQEAAAPQQQDPVAVQVENLPTDGESNISTEQKVTLVVLDPNGRLDSSAVRALEPDQRVHPHGEGAHAAVQTAFLPDGVSTQDLAAQLTGATFGDAPAGLSAGSQFNPASLITIAETEPNDTFGTADLVPLGFDGAEDVAVDVNGTMNSGTDVDLYSVELNAGDIFGANVGGAGEILLFADSFGNLLMGSAQDATFIHPAASPLPGGGNAALSWVAETTGTYYLQVETFGTTGAYTLNTGVFRPELEQQTVGSHQILFLDFDGETIDTSIFGGPGVRTLSGLSSYLPGWGLTGANESAVIDAIVASVTESMSTDIRALGNNGDFDTSGVNGHFDIEILNSRDHADPFGMTNVSRVIIGGSIAESGISTIGIAESIDVGNFETEESALVLLDLLSASAANPNSLNQFAIAAGSSIVDLIGVGVGNIVAHEAGHFFSNWHTENSNATPNIMDRGGNLANLVGVGGDLIFGTGDDIDVDFGDDTFTSAEGFIGTEDTLNSIAFGLSTGTVTVGGPAIGAGGAFVAVTNDTNDTVSLIDPVTRTVVSSGSLGGSSGVFGDIVASPDGTTVWASAWDLQSVVRFDISSGTPVVVATINVGFPTEEVSITPDGRFLLTNDGGGTHPLVVIDTATNAIVDSLNLGHDINSSDVNANGSVLVTSSSTVDQVRRLTLDGAGNLTDTGESLLFNSPNNVVFAPDGMTAVVMSWSGTGAIQSFAVAGLAPLDTQATGGGGGSSVVFSPAGDRIYTRDFSGLIEAYSYDPVTGLIGNAPLFSIAGPSTGNNWYAIEQVAISADGSELYVADGGGNDLNIYDALTGAYLDSVAGLSGPVGVASFGSLVSDTTGLSISGTDLVITDIEGGDTDDNFTITTNGSTLTIVDNNGGTIDLGAVTGTGDGTDTVTVNLTEFAGGIIFDTLGGDDSLTVDFGSGNFGRALTFNGGDQDSTNPGDQLFLQGGATFTDATYNYTNANDGSIDITGNQTITYTGLEPITSTITATNVTLNYNSTDAEDITISDSGANITVNSTAGELTTFAEPTGLLTINSQQGDTLTVVTAVSLAAGLDFTSGDITVNGALTSTAGSVELTTLGSGSAALNRLFAYDTSANLVREVDPVTGAILNSFASPVPEAGPDYGMATTGTSLLVGGSAGAPIRELDPDTGATIRTIANPGINVSGMAFLDGEIYLLTDNVGGQITVLNYTTGTVARTITTPTVVDEGIGASGSDLYGTDGLEFYRIDRNTGSTTFLGNLPSSGYSEGVGFIGDELFVALQSSIGVYDLATLTLQRTLTGIGDLEAIGADGGGGGAGSSGGGIILNVDVNAALGDVTMTATGTITQADGTSISTAAGTISLTAEDDVTLASAQTGGAVEITSNSGAIIDAGDSDPDIDAATAVLDAATGVGTSGDALDTELDNLEADGGSGGVYLGNTGGLTIGDIGAMVGVSATGGDIHITVASPLTVNEDVVNSGGGDITLLAGGTAASSVFQITGLTANNFTIIDHNSVTGDDDGGIAVSSTSVFYDGDSGTGRFDLATLGGGANLGTRYHAMVSNIRTGQLYSLGTSPVAQLTEGSSSAVSYLLEHDASGNLTGASIPLSASIAPGSYGTGFFSGSDRVVIVNPVGDVFNIDLPTGAVTNLGNVTLNFPQISEVGRFWGVAEFDGSDVSVVYANSGGTDIVRTNVTTDATTVVATFAAGLSDMAAFTVSPIHNRWYFHHESSSGTFGGSTETLGFADATFTALGGGGLATPGDDITINANVTATGGDGDITITAGDELIQSAATTVSAAGAGTIDMTGGTSVTMAAGSAVQSDTGNIDLSGNADGNGLGGNHSGVKLSGASVQSTSGDITITGEGGDSGSSNTGVSLLVGSGLASSVSTGGTIDITGTGGSGGYYNHGVEINGSSVTSTSSAATAISIDGTGGVGNGFDYSYNGIDGYYATVTANNGGIDLDGTGGSSTTSNFNAGISLIGSEVSGASLDVTGQGGDGVSYNRGILLSSGTELDATAGNAILTGTGGGAGSYNDGIYLDGSFVDATGTLTLMGTGSTDAANSFSNSGILLYTSTVSGVTGLDIDGIGGTGSGGYSHGVNFSSSSATSTAGAVTITGTANNSAATAGYFNTGAGLHYSTVQGVSLDIDGTGGSGTWYNRGVVTAGGSLTATGGAIAIDGSSANTTSGGYNDGIYLQGTTTDATGKLTITGTGSTSTTNSTGNNGVYILGGSADGDGGVEITGTGGTGSGGYNAGVYLYGVTSVDGGSNEVKIDGTADGSINTAGYFNVGTNIQYSTVSGRNLDIDGIGGSGSWNNRGVMTAGGSLTATAGAIDIDGGSANNTNGGYNDGVYMSGTASTASGQITIDGTGSTSTAGNTTANNGVYLYTGSVNGGGGVAITGIGGTGSGGSNYGTNINYTSIGGGSNNVTISGTADSTTGGSYNVGAGVQYATITGATITIDGTGGGGGWGNRGVLMTGGTTTASATSGTGITVTGDSANNTAGGGNDGVQISGSSLSAAGSRIVIDGDGSTGVTNTSSNNGVYLSGATLTSRELELTGDGGAGSGGFNYGVYLYGGTITTTGSAITQITGNGGTGAGGYNYGAYLYSATVSATNSTLDIDGTASNSTGGTTNTGVGLQYSYLSGDAVNVVGFGGSGSDYNRGIYLIGGSVSADNGGVYLGGAASVASSTGAYNEGINASGATVTSTSGAVTIEGNGGQAAGNTHSSHGVYLYSIIANGSTGTTITGNGGTGTDGSSSGVTSYYSTIGVNTSTTTITGTAHGSTGGSYNVGTSLQYSTVIGSTLNIEGTGGSGADNNRGVYIVGGSAKSMGVTTIVGNTNGGTTGWYNHGVDIQSAEVGGSTSTTVTGDGGGGLGFNHGIYMYAITEFGVTPFTTIGTMGDGPYSEDTAGDYFP